MVKDAFPFHNLLNDFICFYSELVPKFNVRQQQIVLVAHNGTQFYIPFLFAKMEY